MEIDWNKTYLYLRGFLELLSFMSGGVIAVLGFFVFRQLKLAQESLETAKETLTIAKDDIQIRIQREAVILAAELSEKFGKEVIPKVGKLIDEFADEKISINEWQLENYLFDQTSIKNLNLADEWLSSLNSAKKRTQIMQILNEHESFAMYFIGGAADEQVAYPSIASVFCSNVKRFAPLLLALRVGPLKSETASGPFQNTIALFEMWSSRLKKEDLDSQAAKLTAESSGIHITNIPILGNNKTKK